jgi:hypothetical protein
LIVAIDWINCDAVRPLDLADASLVVAALKTGSATIWPLERNDFASCHLPGRKHFRPV